MLQDDVRVYFRRAGPRLRLRRRGRREVTLPGFRIRGAATQVLIGRDRAAPLSQYIRLSITRPLSIGHRRVSIWSFVDWTTPTYCSAIVDRATPMHSSGDRRVLTAVYYYWPIVGRATPTYCSGFADWATPIYFSGDRRFGQRRILFGRLSIGRRGNITRAASFLDNADMFYLVNCRSDSANILLGRCSIGQRQQIFRAVVV